MTLATSYTEPPAVNLEALRDWADRSPDATRRAYLSDDDYRRLPLQLQRAIRMIASDKVAAARTGVELLAERDEARAEKETNHA